MQNIAKDKSRPRLFPSRWKLLVLFGLLGLILMAFPLSIPGYDLKNTSHWDWYYPSSGGIFDIARHCARILLIIVMVLGGLGVIFSKVRRALVDRHLSSKELLFLITCIYLVTIAVLWPLILAKPGAVIAGILFTSVICVLMAGFTLIFTLNRTYSSKKFLVVYFILGMLTGICWTFFLSIATYKYFYDITISLDLGTGYLDGKYEKSFPLGPPGKLWRTTFIACLTLVPCLVIARKFLYGKPIAGAIAFFLPFYPLAILTGISMWHSGLSN